MILDQFDPHPRAVINPEDTVTPLADFPRIAVSCFSHVTMDRLVRELHAEQIALIHVANLDIPVYRARYHDLDVALFTSYVGAPGCVSLLEDLFVLGAQRLVLFGTCGVLDASIADCSILIPDRAVRDEGTSYHYAPAADEIEVNPRYREAFIDILNRHGCSYTVGKVWTNDAIYRETREKVRRRREDGCVCVDMECSAVAALAAFRGKEVFHFFYAADHLADEAWNPRSLSNTSNLLQKDRIALLAMELAERMADEEG